MWCVQAMMRFFSSTCADEVDATAFRDLYHDFTESPTDPIALPLDWHHTVSNAKAISHSALKPPHIPPRCLSSLNLITLFVALLLCTATPMYSCATLHIPPRSLHIES